MCRVDSGGNSVQQFWTQRCSCQKRHEEVLDLLVQNLNLKKNKKIGLHVYLLLRITDTTQFVSICCYFFLSFCFTSCFIQYVLLKTSVSHERRWRGRHQPRRKTERKTSASGEDAEEDISHGGICRGRHQPRRKMERKRAATTRRTEDCPSGPAPLSSVQTKNTRRGNVCRSLSVHVQPTRKSYTRG